MIKIIRLTTVPLSLDLLIKGQPQYMSKMGFNVILSSAPGNEIGKVEMETGLKVNILPLTRTISPLDDIKALWKTYLFIKKECPEIVHTHTPKAGIIGMLASKLAGVPIRMHTVAGLPLLEAMGFKRKILNTVERITSWAATNVYPNSFTLKDIMVKGNLSPKNKLKVIAKGSSNGLDTHHFSNNHFSANDLILQKNILGINENDVVCVFIGRIVKDKGINELLEAFNSLSESAVNLKLLLVGTQEKELDPLSDHSLKILNENKRIIQVEWQEDVRAFLAVSDIFVFPSYREGFPNVVMQAGAMELPSIVTDINGSNEIIWDGVNGLVIPVKDARTLEKAIKLLIANPEKRKKMAQNARPRIIDNYEQSFVWNCLLHEYIELLDRKGIKHQIPV